MYNCDSCQGLIDLLYHLFQTATLEVLSLRFSRYAEVRYRIRDWRARSTKSTAIVDATRRAQFP